MFIPQVFVKKSRYGDGKYFVAAEVGARSVERPDATIYKRLSSDVDYRTAWAIAHKEIEVRNEYA